MGQGRACSGRFPARNPTRCDTFTIQTFGRNFRLFTARKLKVFYYRHHFSRTLQQPASSRPPRPLHFCTRLPGKVSYQLRLKPWDVLDAIKSIKVCVEIANTAEFHSPINFCSACDPASKKFGKEDNTKHDEPPEMFEQRSKRIHSCVSIE